MGQWFRPRNVNKERVSRSFSKTNFTQSFKQNYPAASPTVSCIYTNGTFLCITPTCLEGTLIFTVIKDISLWKKKRHIEQTKLKTKDLIVASEARRWQISVKTLLTWWHRNFLRNGANLWSDDTSFCNGCLAMFYDILELYVLHWLKSARLVFVKSRTLEQGT